MKLNIQIANLSDVGKKRTTNEDYYGFFEIEGLKAFIVSDGMGGYKGGYLASHLVVDTFKNYFEKKSNNFDNVSEVIKEALKQADLKIKQKADEDAELKDMGATAVVFVIKNNTAYIAHIGDSRVYLIRNSQIKKITKDHSLVQQMLDSGLITEDLAKTHPNRNVITHSLGYGGKSDVEIHTPFQLFRNDIIILCTDGLTGYVEDNEIKDICLNNEPVTAVHKLIDLANQRGGKDNITVQVVKILNGKRPPSGEKVKKQIVNFLLYSTIILTGFILLTFILLYTGILENIEEIKNKASKPEKSDTISVQLPPTIIDTIKKSSDLDSLKREIDSEILKKKQHDDKFY